MLQAQRGKTPEPSFKCQVMRQGVQIIHGAQRIVPRLTCSVQTGVLAAHARSGRTFSPSAASRDELPPMFVLPVTEGGPDAPRILFRENVYYRPINDLTTVDASLSSASESTAIDVFVRLLGADERWFSRTVPVVDSKTLDNTLPPSSPIAINMPAGARAPIHLVPFDSVAVAGEPPVEVQIFDPAVSRVVYHLDDKQVAVTQRAPFRVWLILPIISTPIVLRATAYDDTGQRVGEDHLALNQSYDRLRATTVGPLANAEILQENPVAYRLLGRLERLLQTLLLATRPRQLDDSVSDLRRVRRS